MISLIYEPNEFSNILNIPYYGIQSDSVDSSIMIYARIFIEITPGNGDFLVAYENRLFLDDENQTNLILSGLESFLKTSKPNISATSFNLVPDCVRKYKISLSEFNINNDQIVSENFSNSELISVIAPLETQLTNNSTYSLEISGTSEPIDQVRLIASDNVSTQNINSPIIIGESLYYEFTASSSGNKEWTQIRIEPNRKYTIKENIKSFTEFPSKYIIKSGADND